LLSNANKSGTTPKIKMMINDGAKITLIMEYMRWLYTECESGENILFYFSGHGEEGTGLMDDYLISYDTDSTTPNQSLQVQYIKNMIKICLQKNANVILIVDACKSGSIAFNEFFSESAEDKEFESKHVIKLFSCQPNEKSLEDQVWKHPFVSSSEGGGVFTYNLLLGLYGLADTKSDGTIKYGEIRSFMYEKVSKQTLESQNPSIYGNPKSVLSIVDPEISGNLKSINIEEIRMSAPGKKSGMFAPEDAGVTDSIKNKYIEFQKNLNLKRLYIPEGDGNDAYSNYLYLRNSNDTSEQVRDMEYKLVAALRDKSFFALDQYLKGKDYYDQNMLTEAYNNLTAVLTFLNENDIFYNEVKAQKLFFEGVLVSSSESGIEKGIELYKEAISLIEYASYIYNELGLLYIRTKQYDLARNNFIRASLYSEKWAMPVYNTGLLYYENKLDFKQAAYYFSKAIKLNPKYVSAYSMRGNSYYRLKKYGKAVKDWEKVILLDPSKAPALLPYLKDAKKHVEKD
jgi:tetratricopeptide (TPR) repeat protein